jgi:dTDP-glucose 4,6-dehydratase
MNTITKKILVTGGAGFIGSNFVELALGRGYQVIVLDALTYAGKRENLAEFEKLETFHFVHGKIQDEELVEELLEKNKVSLIANFAAESHVDNSITGPAPFIETNVVGTFKLLSAAKKHFDRLSIAEKSNFRFLHVSTDEVFGQLGPTGKFSETTPYQPNSPYSASKAASDHLVRAWHHTYALPTITTNCSNNYGPKHFPEKLIPHVIQCALQGKRLPVYGKGENIRDWIHVKDHAAGVLLALEKGIPGETYCFGGNSERKNIDVVNEICKILDELKPKLNGQSYQKQIEFVTDRLGHDFRYAIDDAKAQKELGFTRQFKDFETGLRDTVLWFLAHSFKNL